MQAANNFQPASMRSAMPNQQNMQQQQMLKMAAGQQAARLQNQFGGARRPGNLEHMPQIQPGGPPAQMQPSPGPGGMPGRGPLMPSIYPHPGRAGTGDYFEQPPPNSGNPNIGPRQPDQLIGPGQPMQPGQPGQPGQVHSLNYPENPYQEFGQQEFGQQGFNPQQQVGYNPMMQDFNQNDAASQALFNLQQKYQQGNRLV